MEMYVTHVMHVHATSTDAIFSNGIGNVWLQRAILIKLWMFFRWIATPNKDENIGKTF